MIYITENVINIDSRLDIWAQIRSETLDRCYSIPGYAEKSTEEKAKIYDRIKTEVETELFDLTTRRGHAIVEKGGLYHEIYF